MALIGLTLPLFQFFDDNGDPADGWLLHTYIAGTDTAQETYSDSTGTLNSNPIELDSAGRCVIYVPDDVSLKLIMKNADSVTQWTQDAISPAALAE